MSTPNVRDFQQQVRADFAAYQAKHCCSAKKAVDRLNTASKKNSVRTILNLGQMRQLIDKHIDRAELIRLQIFAKNLSQQLTPVAA